MTYDVNARAKEGSVHFSMHGPDQPLAVIIDGEALERYFGAGSDADSQLEAYAANFRIIHSVAQLKSTEHPAPIRLTVDDFTEDSIRHLREENEE